MNLAPLLVLLIASAIAVPAFSNPLGATVVNGSAAISQSGNVLTVTNSNGAIINWNKFSIAAGETTHFSQPSASSSVLNRVMNDPTVIYGTLSSNGHVTNQGIITTPQGEAILAAGATVSLSDTATPGVRVDITGSEGTSTNLGLIAAEAGSIVMAGVNVRNSGFLEASNVNITSVQSVFVTGGGAITATGDVVINAGSDITVNSEGTFSGGHNISIKGSAINMSSGSGSIYVTGGMIATNPSNLTLSGGGNIAGSSSGGSLRLARGSLAVATETRKLLQQTAGAISLRGAASVQPVAPTPIAATATAPAPLRASTPTARLVNTGSLVDGAVTVRLSLVDASPISLR